MSLANTAAPQQKKLPTGFDVGVPFMVGKQGNLFQTKNPPVWNKDPH